MTFTELFNIYYQSGDLGISNFAEWCYEYGRKSVVKEHEETFEWCHDCKEYDQENHCCCRWTKVIHKTLDDMKESIKNDTLDKFLNMIPDCDYVGVENLVCIAEQIKE